MKWTNEQMETWRNDEMKIDFLAWFLTSLTGFFASLVYRLGAMPYFLNFGLLDWILFTSLTYWLDSKPYLLDYCPVDWILHFIDSLAGFYALFAGFLLCWLDSSLHLLAVFYVLLVECHIQSGRKRIPIRPSKKRIRSVHPKYESRSVRPKKFDYSTIFSFFPWRGFIIYSKKIRFNS